MKNIYKILAAVGLILLIPVNINYPRSFFKGKKNKLRPCDAGGCGYFGAPRKDHIHEGVDIICTPGTTVISPVDGIITRSFLPYANDKNYNGIEILTVDNKIKIMYMLPYYEKIGTAIKSGDAIGVAQDISKKYYSAVTPHLHVELWENGKPVNGAGFFNLV
jgi:septal ring factor EnvC (AmiA/AmiB activator)